MSLKDSKEEFFEHLEDYLSVVFIMFFDALSILTVVGFLLGSAWALKQLLELPLFDEERGLLPLLPYYDMGVVAVAILMFTGRLMKGLIVRLFIQPRKH